MSGIAGIFYLDGSPVDGQVLNAMTHVVSHRGPDGIARWVQGSVGLVYPSLEEGFGLQPLEAMALGTPVVACASMSIPEVCGDGALLFQPGDDQELAGLMETLLAGGQPVADLIQRGHDREQGFSWKRCADATVACYRRATAVQLQYVGLVLGAGRDPGLELWREIVLELFDVVETRRMARRQLHGDGVIRRSRTCAANGQGCRHREAAK